MHGPLNVKKAHKLFTQRCNLLFRPKRPNSGEITGNLKGRFPNLMCLQNYVCKGYLKAHCMFNMEPLLNQCYLKYRVW